jgi:hypothetical protein
MPLHVFLSHASLFPCAFNVFDCQAILLHYVPYSRCCQRCVFAWLPLRSCCILRRFAREPSRLLRCSYVFSDSFRIIPSQLDPLFLRFGLFWRLLSCLFVRATIEKRFVGCGDLALYVDVYQRLQRSAAIINTCDLNQPFQPWPYHLVHNITS